MRESTLLVLCAAADDYISSPESNGIAVRDALVKCGIVPKDRTVRAFDLRDAEEMRLRIDKILEEAEQGGYEVLIYYSGHGSVLPTSSADFGGYSANLGKSNYYWAQLLTEVAVRRNVPHVTLIFDSCHSGLFVDEVVEKNLVHKISVVSSCQKDEKSFEDPNLKIGYFSEAFCSAISELWGAPGQVGCTLAQVYATTVKRIRSSGKQTPKLGCSDQRKNTIFISKVKTKREFYSTFPTEISRRIQEDPKLGILLHARQYWKAIHGQDVRDAFFELSSQTFARSFISLWELFDEQELLADSVKWLAEAALEIYNERPFSCIVTCTDTAKELGRYVRTELIGLKLRLPICHLGYPPSVEPLTLKDRWLIDSNCLVLTDVIASGTLIKRTVQELNNGNNNVVGVIAFALSNPAQIEEYKLTQILPCSRGEIPVMLRCLSLVPIALKSPDEIKPLGRVIPIDHAIVLPRLQQRAAPTIFEPLIGSDKMFQHFDDAGAIKSGCYEIEGEPVFSLLDIASLILRFGKSSIWPVIKERFGGVEALRTIVSEGMAVVSSFKENDVLFRNFVLKMLNEEGVESSDVPCFTVKRQTKDDRVIFDSDTPFSIRLDDRHVWVVFGTSSSTEKIRSVSGFLSTKSPRSVTIISLVSRAGICSSEFLYSIAEFGNKKESANGKGAKFEFCSVYNMHEIDSVKARLAYSKLHDVLKGYLDYSSQLIFRRKAQKLIDLFSIESTDAVSHSTEDQPLPNVVAVNDLKTLDAEIALAVYEYTTIGQFDRLKGLLETNTDPLFFRILTLVIVSDVSRLEISGSLDAALEVIWNRIVKSQNDRFNAEEKFHSDPKWDEMRIVLMENIRVEIALVEVFVVLHKFATGVQTKYQLSRIVTAGRTAKEWMNFMFNRVFCFADDDLCFSYLLHHFGRNRRASSESENAFQNRQDAEVRSFLIQLLEQSRISVEASGGRRLRAGGYLPTWILECAIEELSESSKMSFTQLIFRIWWSINRSWNEDWAQEHRNLDRWIAAQPPGRTINLGNTIGIVGGSHIRKTMQAQNRLFQTASHLRRLIYYSPAHKVSSRYLLGPKQQGLLFDLSALDEILSESNRTGWIPNKKALEYRAIFERVDADFGLEAGEIRSVVNGFFCDPFGIIERVIAMLAQRGFHQRLTTLLNRTVSAVLTSAGSKRNFLVAQDTNIAARVICEELTQFLEVYQNAIFSCSLEEKEFGIGAKNCAELVIVVRQEPKKSNSKANATHHSIVRSEAEQHWFALGGGIIRIETDIEDAALLEIRIQGVFDNAKG